MLTLALGIGANTAIFSMADAVLLRTLPVSSRGISSCFVSAVRPAISSLSPPLAPSIRGQPRSSGGPRGVSPALNTHVSVNGETELALSQSVSGNYHAVLGIRAAVGRTLTEQDREPVAVISHRYWERRFAGDADVVGRVLEMQGRSSPSSASRLASSSGHSRAAMST